jgi:hypothetical protein
MLRRLCFPLLAVAAVLATLATGPPASGAIRITISDGSANQVFLATSNNSASFETSIGGVELFLTTATSNFPGTVFGANLLTTINVNDVSSTGAGTLPTFTVTTELVDGAGNLLRFTLPTDTVLRVSSDVSSAEPIFISTTGTVRNRTTVNGTIVDSATLGINATMEGEVLGTAPNTPDGFTLSSQVTIAGANVGTGLSISASSAVIGGPLQAPGIPEPSSVAVLGLGSLSLGLIAASRRRRQAKSA